MSGRKYQVLEETTTIHTLYTHAYETTEMYTQYIRMYDRNDNDVHVNLQTWVLRDNIWLLRPDSQVAGTWLKTKTVNYRLT